MASAAAMIDAASQKSSSGCEDPGPSATHELQPIMGVRESGAALSYPEARPASSSSRPSTSGSAVAAARRPGGLAIGLRGGWRAKAQAASHTGAARVGG